MILMRVLGEIEKDIGIKNEMVMEMESLII